MADITEKEIEQFIRFPGKLSAKQRMRIGNAIDSSKELQDLANFFKEFSELFSDIARRSRKTNVVSLTAFDPEPEFGSSNRLVLAAQTSQGSAGTLDTIATLASEENETLVRILNEKETEKYRIHVLSNLLDARDMSILSLPDIGIDLVINEEGRLRFSPDFDLENYNWESASFELRLPIERFSVPISDSSGEKVKTFESQDFSLQIESKGGYLEGEVISKADDPPNFSRILVRGPQTSPSIARISEGAFAIPFNEQESSLVCWLYE